MSAKPQPEWMATLQVGDVLTNGSAYRVVRRITRWRKEGRRTFWDEGPLRSVTFTIKHCSWTGRCYTLLTPYDLIGRGFRPAGARVKLNKPIDAEVLREITQSYTAPILLKCCDVRAVA